jgi:hypothetical protein
MVLQQLMSAFPCVPVRVRSEIGHKNLCVEFGAARMMLSVGRRG